MKRVLFSHSYFLRLDAKQWKIQEAYPPLATLYAASVLRTSGYEVQLFDSMFCEGPFEIENRIRKLRPDYFILYDDGFNYLTKMCLTNMREAAFRMIDFARKEGIKVIVSGSDSTDHFDAYLDAGADFIIYGEGERSLKELVQAIDSGEQDFYGLAGIYFRHGKKTVKTGKRDVLKNIDELPEPAWDLVDMEEYKSRWIKSHGYFSLNISTTRGCPFHCNWCAKPIYGNRYSVHSPGRVVKEMKFLNEKFGAGHFWITDDIFALKPGWIQDFAKEMRESGLKIKYKIQSRVDLLTQANTVELLAESGCESVWMGAESGSQKILDAMDKGTNVSQIREATHLLKRFGIKASFFLQFGYPGETRDDIEKTLQMVMELMPADIGISVSYPLPGTKFYEKVKQDLASKSNWTDSDDLSMMFQNTYPPEFYKTLQRFVHRKYRTRQGLVELGKFLKQPHKTDLAKLRRIAALPVYYSGSLYYRKQMEKLQKQGEPEWK